MPKAQEAEAQGYALVYILRKHPGYGEGRWEYREELGEQLKRTLNHC